MTALNPVGPTAHGETLGEFQLAHEGFLDSSYPLAGAQGRNKTCESGKLRKGRWLLEQVKGIEPSSVFARIFSIRSIIGYAGCAEWRRASNASAASSLRRARSVKSTACCLTSMRASWSPVVFGMEVERSAHQLGGQAGGRRQGLLGKGGRFRSKARPRALG